jgi:hypothetical protein
MQNYDPTILIQAPSYGKFLSINLEWTANDVAYIPWTRLDDFVDGEGRRDKHCETSFLSDCTFPQNDVLGSKSTLMVVAQMKYVCHGNSVPEYCSRRSILPSVMQKHRDDTV